VAIREAAGSTGDVELLDDVLSARRSAPLAAGLVHLSIAFSALLLLLAVLGVALAAAVEAPARAESLGRLRSLGLGQAELRRVLGGELLAPVLVGAVAGFVLGVGCALTTLGPLSLELVTGQTTAPRLVVPWWTVLTVAVLVVAVLVTTQLESSRLRRAALAELLRSGDRR
jgi:putative ABC transport system permease protein